MARVEPVANYWLRSSSSPLWHLAEGFHSRWLKFSQWLRSDRSLGEISRVPVPSWGGGESPQQEKLVMHRWMGRGVADLPW